MELKALTLMMQNVTHPHPFLNYHLIPDGKHIAPSCEFTKYSSNSKHQITTTQYTKCVTEIGHFS